VEHLRASQHRAVTPIPPAAERMALPEDVEVWLFLGSDQEAPYRGRTEAFHLAFVNTRLSKASVISIPGNLFVFIPGYTMQRLNTAYPLGGMNLVRETLAYNLDKNQTASWSPIRRNLAGWWMTWAGWMSAFCCPSAMRAAACRPACIA
jgi:hypothetical protein